MMEPKEPDEIEQEVFAQWLRCSKFDDGVHDEHRNRLRAKVLQAFDCTQHDTPVVEPNASESAFVSNQNRKPRYREPRNGKPWNRLAAAATVAAGLLGGASLWFTDDSDPVIHSVTELGPVAVVDSDPQLDAALIEIENWRNKVPVAEFFEAVALCEQAQEAKFRESKARQFRWFHESAVSTPPVTSEKG